MRRFMLLLALIAFCVVGCSCRRPSENPQWDTTPGDEGGGEDYQSGEDAPEETE